MCKQKPSEANQQSSPASRQATHTGAAKDLSDHVIALVTACTRYAQMAHDEREEIMARLDALEDMHIDPAAHGRAIQQHHKQ